MKKRLAIFLCVVLAVVVLVTTGCNKASESAPEAPAATATFTHTNTGTITETQTATETATTTQTPTSTPKTGYFREGENSYTGAKDTFIDATITDANYGSCEAVTVSAGTYGVKRGFFYFDVSSIPSHVTVTSAYLMMYVYSDCGPVSFNFYNVNTLWSEGGVCGTSAVSDTATWSYARYGIQSWSAGGEFDGVDMGGLGFGAITPGAYFNLQLSTAGVNYVQGWVNTPSNNKGVVMKITNETADQIITLRSGEYSTISERPRLAVMYIE